MKKYLIAIFYIIFSTTLFAQVRYKTSEQDYRSPKEYIIEEITISGIEFLDPNAVIAITNLKIGDKIAIPGDQISIAIKRIWDQGLIGDIQVSITKIEGNKISLDFNLKERPRLSKFVFNKGVKKGEKEDLLEKIDQAKGTVVNDAIIKNSQKKIRNFYLDKGYYNAEVSVVPVKDSLLPNNIYLKVNVDRKKKIRIKNIVFEGNETFADNLLKKKMKKTKEKRLYKFFVSSKFIKKLYEADKEKIIDLYNTKGYRDAKIVHDSVFRSGKNRVSIDIKIEEGRKYYFRNITWKGNYIYNTRLLDSILNIKKGTVYNSELLSKKLTFNPNGIDISSLYLDNGYLFFSVDPVEIQVDGDSIDIEMRIYEGKQATIDRITISGNTKTHDQVILREIRTLPGDKFSRADLIRTQRELSTIGYFDPEKIEINPVPNQAKGTVDIHYKVEEKPSDQIQLSGGWGGGGGNGYGYGGLVGTLGLVFNNFSAKNITNFKTWDPLPSGDGQRFSINFQSNGRQYQNYAVSFMEPWFGGKKPISLTTSLNHSELNYYNSNTGNYDQHLDISTVTVGLGRRLKRPDDYFTLNNSLSYSFYNFRNYKNFAQLGSDTGSANNFALNTTISRNSLDELNFPTKGASIALTVSLTPPYSLFNGFNYSDPNLSSQKRYKFVEYNKWMFDCDWYATLAAGKKRNLVIRMKTNFGVIAPYNSAAGLGPFERFVMGGNGFSGNVNNFIGTDLIGLRGYQSGSLPYDKYTTNLGGTAFNKFTVEIRYPIVTSQALSLSMLGFFDAGNTWAKTKDFNPLDLYRAAGIGARIFMPAFGLIGLDYGWPMDNIPNQGSPYQGVFTFTIGQQIR